MRVAVALVLLALAHGPAQAAPPQAAPPDRLVASGSRTVLGCPAGAVQVSGSGNRVTVAGRCRSLEVAGSDNEVAIDLLPGAVARIDGDRNRIVFAGTRAPEAVTHGAFNLVVPQPPDVAVAAVAAVPEPPVLLDPGSPSFDVSCRDRDVVISGDFQRYVLRGGCRSVTVRGQSDTITAELQPGALLAIGGAGVLLNYVLVADGPAPVVRVTAPGLRAKHIQHFGGSALTLATTR